MTFWDFCAPFYNAAEAVNGYSYSEMIKTVRRFVPYGATVLDVACGTGNVSLSAAHKAWRVTGVDLSVPMLRAARNGARSRKIRNVRFGLGDICDLEAKDGSYDVVIASQILHLLDDPGKAAAELRRVAGKRVIMTIPLTKGEDGKVNIPVLLYKLAGFRPKRELDLRGCVNFLKEIGFTGGRVIYIPGTVPIAAAVWEKHSE